MRHTALSPELLTAAAKVLVIWMHCYNMEAVELEQIRASFHGQGLAHVQGRCSARNICYGPCIGCIQHMSW